MPFAAGDRVTVRGERWIVEEATAFAGTTVLSLTGADHERTGRRCRVLTPFDRPVATPRHARIRGVTRRRWMHQLHAHTAALRGYRELRAPVRAAIDILPFQLEPVLALVRGEASRFLLADEVGLGKTIQAGLMLAELLQRGWCERALIVTPAGLRAQWADELLQRFDLRTSVIDAASLSVRASTLPFAVNPWTVETITITSIDFLKQAEVLRGLMSESWDALIVDEAHHATAASLRYEALDALSRRARHVVLITATPHAGDDHAYRALCAIGRIAEDDRLLLFRRTRVVQGVPRSRRAHLLPVRLTVPGLEMHRLLDAYLVRLWTVARTAGNRDVQLAAMVLAKRAFSSARSLAISLERRLTALSGAADTAPLQTSLPLGLEDDRSDEPPLPVAPAFDRIDTERATLQQLIDATWIAAHDEPKMRALKRLLRRVREPLIVFTEYRDTLETVAGALSGFRRITTLHGGQTPQERRHSVHAFTSGQADVMIATDAGSEGLNLHRLCRLIVNLELPWNPIRLEQRIGRVDRIGQTRTVHAINLLADGTPERTVLANLLRRIDRIRMSEIDIASCVIGQSQPPPQSPPAETCTETIDLGIEARAEALRITRTGARNLSPADESIPITVLRRTRPALVAFFHIRLVTRAGRLVEDMFVPVHLPLDAVHERTTPGEAVTFAEMVLARAGPDLAGHARQHAERRARTIEREASESIARAVRREQAITSCLAPSLSLPVQPGLFDTRALKEQRTLDERRDDLRQEGTARANLLRDDATIRVARDPELSMLLLLCSRG